MSSYWVCQLVGWSIYGLVTAAIPTLYGGLRGAVIARAVVGAVLGVAFSDGLRRQIRRNGWLQLPPRQLVPRICLASVAIAAAMVIGILPFLVRFIPPDRTGPIVAIFVGHVAIISIWSGTYLAVQYLRGLRAAEAEKWRLVVAMRDAELRALRAQLNPHFLFNSLNSLRGLVVEDPARARVAITALAALLRFALISTRARTVTLDRELEAIRHYLELETLRFEARLQYWIEIDPEALEHPLPPMLIQTLVENAIKHGIARLPEGGTIRIEAQKRTDELHVRVTNTGTLSLAGEPAGFGLVNSLERLRLIFGDRARIDLWQSGADEVTCDVIVPTHTEQSEAPLAHSAAES